MRPLQNLLLPDDPDHHAEGFKVTSSGSVVMRRPVPRNVAAALALTYPKHRIWEAVAALEPSMEPWPWLDMVLRLGASSKHAPTPVVDGLRRTFPHFRPSVALIGKAAQWWNGAVHPLTIWRGCYEGVNESGVCWSQDPLTASSYAQPGGHGRARALLIEATVNDGDYIAHTRERSQLEILVLPECPVVVARHELPAEVDFFTQRRVPL